MLEIIFQWGIRNHVHNVQLKGLTFIYRINSKRRALMRARLATKHTVSRTFNLASEDRISHLKEICLKPTSESVVNWGVNAYNEWRNYRLETYNYDFGIYNADINDLPNLKKENLNHALCRFIPEVTKKKGDGPYPGRTLYQMVGAIQKYLNVNKIPWVIAEGKGSDFEEVRTVLDNVMKERTAANIGVVKRQAGVVTKEIENELWQKGLLGEDTPDKLCNTVLFLLGLNVTLRAVDEHYHLRREMPNKSSQLQFERSPSGLKCLVYREDFITKTHDGGIKDRKSERKTVWIYPNHDVTKCTVQLVEKYLSLCPKFYKKEHFYLQSRAKPTPKLWYQEQCVGKNSIAKVVKELLKSCKIDRFFINHSLRRSGGMRLFNEGVDRKLVKEITGHRSDAIDAYQVTSHQQREMCSKILQGQKVGQNERKVSEVETVPKGDDVKTSKIASCSLSVDSNNAIAIVQELLKNVPKQGKAVIKIEIELHNE